MGNGQRDAVVCELSVKSLSKFLNTIFLYNLQEYAPNNPNWKPFQHLLHYESICVPVIFVKISTLVMDDICTFGR